MNIILKSSEEEAVKFFYFENNIYYSDLSEGRFDESRILISTIRENFDACLDNEKNIHIVCQENDDNVIYILRSKQKWYRKIILKTRQNTKISVEKFRIFIVKENVFIIYVLEYKESFLLTFQEIGDDSEPEILDILNREKQNFCLNIDKVGNIYLFYVSEKNNSHFGFKKYIQIEKKWNEFEKICDEVSCFSTLLDENKDTIHLCFVRNNKIFYKSASISSKKEIWQNETKFSYIIQNFAIPVMFIRENKIYIAWSNRIFMTIVNSENYGENWKLFTKNLNFKEKNIDLFKIEYVEHIEKKLRINTIIFYGRLNKRINNNFILSTGEVLLNFSKDTDKFYNRDSFNFENKIISTKNLKQEFKGKKISQEKNFKQKEIASKFKNKSFLNYEKRNIKTLQSEKDKFSLSREDIRKVFESLQDEFYKNINNRISYLESIEEKISDLLNKLVLDRAYKKNSLKNAKRKKKLGNC
ncbi:MAG: hypothetical protein LBJ09_03195 [Clostridiales bacterium]|nr:hypothetical protein [Clostridiales bacterium]